jgi:hypothetical protein
LHRQRGCQPAQSASGLVESGLGEDGASTGEQPDLDRRPVRPGSALRQIGAELGVTATAWDINFARPASPCVATVLRLIPLPQQIRGLRDHGLTWNEVAKQLDMTVSGAWSRYRRDSPQSLRDSLAGIRFSPTHWIKIALSVLTALSA